MMRSEEALSRYARTDAALPSLRRLRPDAYVATVDRTNGAAISAFQTRSAADFDWLENAILSNRYYEHPGVWVLGADADKRVIAEMLASFQPSRTLELGCASGAVLDCLEQRGVVAEGVEISSMAIERASPAVRARIHHGDLLTLPFSGTYDLLFGLDVFEHLNPNRLGAYIERIHQITTSDAYVFCNIPAFGDDPVFGTVFPLYIDGWDLDAAAGRPFALLHVDDDGYPIHGHLVWADSGWWTAQFGARGFEREPDIERAFHRKYDDYMRKRAPARRSFYVFSKDGSAARRDAVIARIAGQRSTTTG